MTIEPTGAPAWCPHDTLDRVRALRLWHWCQLLQSRAHALRAASGSLACRYNDEANRHLRFVQTLNDFFPLGDTAERDAAK